MKIRRKVVIVFGKWGKKTDFVLEPVCKDCEKDGNECDVCKNYVYIEGEKKPTKKGYGRDYGY